jgi:MATE family multidrug resistance protein
MADDICRPTESSPLLSVQEEGTSSDGHLEVGKKEEEANKANTGSMLADVVDTLHLAVPIFMSRVSFTGMKTIDTALLGHVSGRALSAAALSDLWTMCTQVLIQGRVLSILVGQAIGAKNYYLALVYLRISYFILGMLSIFVMISWFYTEQVWIMLGQSRDIAQDAGYYSFVFIFSIPPQLGFGQLSQFLSAQRIMTPGVIASFLALLCNLVLGMALVLGIPFPGFDGFGFKACPIVTVSVAWCQCLFLYFYWMKCVDNTSLPGGLSSGNNRILSWTEGMTIERISTFSKLYFPAALALSSDFWRMGVMGAIAASIGEREVGVFNASYRILWITLIFVGSLSGASGIKIAQRLGSGDVQAAKQAAAGGIALTFLILLFLSSFVYFNIRRFGSLFTNDESYLDLFEECRWPFTCVLFAMNFAVGIETIPLSMGQTGNVFYSGFVASWLGQVPGVILLIRFWRHDLYAIYFGVAIGECTAPKKNSF